MLINNQEKEINKAIMAYALKKGCKHVAISFLKGSYNSFEYRNNTLERLEANTENRIYFDLYVNNRFGSFSSNRLDRLELEKFVSDAVDSVKLLEPDADRQLADSRRYYVGENNLRLVDETYYSISTDEKLDVLRNSIKEISGKNNNIVSVTTSYDDSTNSVYMLTSNGFENTKSNTRFGLVSNVVLSTNTDAKIDALDYSMATHWAQVNKKGISIQALQKAMAKQEQTKIQSGTYDLITDNRSGGKLLNPIIAAISGGALYQKKSFLLGKKGQQVFSEKINLFDYPHQIQCLGSRLYDGEGVATFDRTIIKQGVLNEYFLSTYYANKLQLTPTISAPSGLCLQLGRKNCEELIQGVERGIWVTGYNGGNTNMTTGDFSFGIEGFYVEKGKIKQPVNEMNITGNFIDLWNKLQEVGNDPLEHVANKIPSLWFKDVKFSGF